MFHSISIILGYILVVKGGKLESQWIGAFAYARYGDRCDYTIPCDHDANLACIHGTCNCSNPHSMIYSRSNLECRVKASERCILMVEKTPEDRRLHQAHRLTFPCTSNATCGEDGICHCTPLYYQDHHGHCVEKKGIGRDCFNTGECSSSLTCWHGRCGCNPHISRPPTGYDLKTTCVGIPHRPCINGECEPNSNCVDGTCLCVPDFKYNETEQRCKGAFDEQCVDDSFCGKEFSCVQSRCKCKGVDNVFDDVMQRCSVIVGDVCMADVECVEHAECRNDGAGRPFCRCIEGYEEFGPGFCRNGYGSKCLEAKETRTYLVQKDSVMANLMHDKFGAERFNTLVPIKLEHEGCDSSRKLHCWHGVCLCKPDVEIYSSFLGKCISLADSLCSLDEDNGCIDHAHCSPLVDVMEKGLTSVGRCKCSQGFRAGRGRMCERVSTFQGQTM